MKLSIPIKFKNGYEAITKSDKKAKGEKNDCAVRAFMNGFDISYDEAHSLIESEFNRKKGKGTFNCANTMREVFTDKDALRYEENKKLPAKVVNGRKLVFLGNNPLVSNRNILLNKLYPKKVYDEETGTYKKEYAGYTVGKFIQQHQFGTYIILVAKHALAVKNGVLIDNGNHNDDLLKNHLRDQRRCMQIFKVKKA